MITSAAVRAAYFVAALVCFGVACKDGEVKAPSSPATGVAAPRAAAPVDVARVPVAAGPVVVLHPPGREVTIRVEIARTDEERTRGLMYREHMDADAGMIFLFPAAEPLSFWMKNTYIPLDMIFIGADQRVVGVVENAEPRTLTSRKVEGRSRFVLEVNGGLTAQIGLRPGSPVEFRNIPP